MQRIKGVIGIEVEELTLKRSQLDGLVKDSIKLGGAERLSVRKFEEDVVARRRQRRARSDSATRRNRARVNNPDDRKADYMRRVEEKMKEFNITKTKAVDLVADNIDMSSRHIHEVLAGRYTCAPRTVRPGRAKES